MAWPSNPTCLAQIPLLEYEEPVFDEAHYMGPATVNALCGVVDRYRDWLESLTSVDTTTEPWVGTLLAGAIIRATGLSPQAGRVDAATRIIENNGLLVDRIARGDHERRLRLKALVLAAVMAGTDC